MESAWVFDRLHHAARRFGQWDRSARDVGEAESANINPSTGVPRTMCETAPMRTSSLVAFALLGLAAAACAAPADAPVDEVGAAESGYTTHPRAGWYRVRESVGKLYVQLANAPNTLCASDNKLDRCSVGEIDLSALGLDADRQKEVEAMYREDIILLYGKAYAVDNGGGGKTLRLVATRAYQNLLRVFPQGNLYEVTKLKEPTACKLARMVSAGPGVFAPPSLETFDGTCTHHARKLNSVQRFDVDEPDWEEDEQWLPFGATMDVVDDLEAGESVITNGNWMSYMDAPFTHPSPVQIWRDVTLPPTE